MNNLKKIIYNCRQATLLIEKKSVTRLTLREALTLRIHLVGCTFCRLFQKQSKVINDMVHELFCNAEKPEAPLSEAFKNNMQRRIEQELNKN